MNYQTDVSKRFIKAIKYIIAEDLAGSSSEVAERIGTHQPTISFIKKGQRSPTVDMICNLCDIYNINPSWLLLGKGDMFLKSQ